MPTAQDFRYVDPRSLDGDLFSVTAATFLQAEAVGDLYQTAIDDAFVFARNAEMERQIQAGQEPKGASFLSTALGGRLKTVQGQLLGVQNGLRATARAAAYNPQAPLEETV